MSDVNMIGNDEAQPPAIGRSTASRTPRRPGSNQTHAASTGSSAPMSIGVGDSSPRIAPRRTLTTNPRGAMSPTRARGTSGKGAATEQNLPGTRPAGGTTPATTRPAQVTRAPEGTQVPEEPVDEDTEMGEGSASAGVTGGGGGGMTSTPANPTPPIINAPPAGRGRKDKECNGNIPPTHFAGLYRSIWTLITCKNMEIGSEIIDSLQHVNCNYLSTKGRAPTLNELKQHAQALVMLIKHVTISTRAGLIDNANSGLEDPPAFHDGETYDFLNDLTKKYTGPKDERWKHHHEMGLTSLMNIARIHTDHNGREYREGEHPIEDICPLEPADMKPLPANATSMPYQRLQSLIEHANAILEIVDHQMSSKGGLFAILPDKNSEDEEERKEYENSQTTILGQLILHNRHPTMRVHELERNLANALDTLAGEAVVPGQNLTKIGPDLRKGRDLVYPQDRFILANAGTDLWDYLDYEFRRKESADEAVRKMYKINGTVGDEVWANRGIKEYERGVTALDITTRYVRLRKDALKTIWIIPAHEHHPRTKATRDLEKVPTVVSVVKPVWPERVSTWEMKNRQHLEQYKLLQDQKEVQERAVEVAEHQSNMLKAAEKQNRIQVMDLTKKLKEAQAAMNGDTDAIIKEKEAAVAKAKDAEDEKKKLADEKKEVERLKKSIQDQNAKLDKELADFRAAREQDNATHNASITERLKLAAEAEEEASKVGAELAMKLKEHWQKQMQETGQLLAILQLHKAHLDANVEGMKEAEQKGLEKGTKAFEDAVAEFRAARRGGRSLENMTPPEEEQRGFIDGSDIEMDD